VTSSCVSRSIPVGIRLIWTCSTRERSVLASFCFVTTATARSVLTSRSPPTNRSITTHPSPSSRYTGNNSRLPHRLQWSWYTLPIYDWTLTFRTSESRESSECRHFKFGIKVLLILLIDQEGIWGIGLPVRPIPSKEGIGVICIRPVSSLLYRMSRELFLAPERVNPGTSNLVYRLTTCGASIARMHDGLPPNEDLLRVT